ncbi:MAG: hypothetical protein AAGI68_16155 [Planctomycetota bacterium]
MTREPIRLGTRFVDLHGVLHEEVYDTVSGRSLTVRSVRCESTAGQLDMLTIEVPRYGPGGRWMIGGREVTFPRGAAA